MSKIQMSTPIVEMDGDEMTGILWKMIKDELILPYVDLKTEYYDLGLENRNKTNDHLPKDSGHFISVHLNNRSGHLNLTHWNKPP